MSGLEPLAALSLACNILQIVEVGRDAVQLAKVVYKTGSIDKTLQSHISSLQQVSNHVKDTRVPQSWPELQKVVDTCLAAAGELQKEVDWLLRKAKPGSLMSMFRIGVKANLHKGRLDSLKRNLDEAEKTLQTSLLASLWHHANISQLDLTTLDGDLRRFVDRYREDHESTQNTIREDGQGTRKHISAASAVIQSDIRLHADTQASEAQHERLLRSLKYPELNKRRNDIKNAFGETFKWIFSEELPPGHRHRYKPSQESEWHSFGSWLQSTSNMYWISGKPGSGKSTLMKYVLTDPQTLKYLQRWKPNAVLISHFFWKPGSPAQRNLKGLLCSLVFQLLPQELHSDLLDKIFLILPGARYKDTESDWSVQELDAVCSRFVDALEQPICLLLDGLDEYTDSDNEIDEIFDLLGRLLKSGKDNMKICVSSRPEPLLQDRLIAYPQLRLQDLTWNDMKSYAKQHVKFPPSHSLVYSLVVKAGGVFLWLCLAIKSINKGYMLGDRDPKLIQMRIDSLPEDLSALYQDMWKRANDESPREYRRTAALYLRLVLGQYSRVPWISYTPADTLDLMFASNLVTDQLLQVDVDEQLPSTVPANMLLQQCRETERKAEVYCAGLLELDAYEPGEVLGVECRHGQDYSQLRDFASQLKSWQLIHRTAYDFLLDTADGHRILGHDTTSGFSISIRVLKSGLAKCRLFQWGSLRRSVRLGRSQSLNETSGIIRQVLDLEKAMKNSKDWIQEEFDQLLFSCERACDAGALLLPTIPLETCMRGPFYAILARFWDTREHLHLDQVSSSKILLKACGWNDNNEFVRTLLRAGADPNCKVPCPFIPGLVTALESPFTACLKRIFLARFPELFNVFGPGHREWFSVSGPEERELDSWFSDSSMARMLMVMWELVSHGANLGETLGMVFDFDEYPTLRLDMSSLSPLNSINFRFRRYEEYHGRFGIAVLPAYAALGIALQTSRDIIQREMDPDDEDEDHFVLHLLSRLEDKIGVRDDDDEEDYNLLLFNPSFSVKDQTIVSDLNVWSGEYSEIQAQKSPKQLIHQLLVNLRDIEGPEAIDLFESWSKEGAKGEGDLLLRLRKCGLIV